MRRFRTGQWCSRGIRAFASVNMLDPRSPSSRTARPASKACGWPAIRRTHKGTISSIAESRSTDYNAPLLGPARHSMRVATRNVEDLRKSRAVAGAPSIPPAQDARLKLYGRCMPLGLLDAQGTVRLNGNVGTHRRRFRRLRFTWAHRAQGAGSELARFTPIPRGVKFALKMRPAPCSRRRRCSSETGCKHLGLNFVLNDETYAASIAIWSSMWGMVLCGVRADRRNTRWSAILPRHRVGRASNVMVRISNAPREVSTARRAG